MESPIFLFSLPRSGSTLLQKILAGHPEIASLAEPWLLLPFFYALKEQGVLSEYSHMHAADALGEFVNVLPNGVDDYNAGIAELSRTLYEKNCRNGERYFLDKTPRYYNIIPQIADSFPEAKFIFLFRNPVHVFSSIVTTWSSGNLSRLYAHDIDLKSGFQLLSSGYGLLKDRAVALQYEDLIVKPESEILRLLDYLELEYDADSIRLFSQQLPKGKMGDKTGLREYKSIDQGSLDKWRQTFGTRVRRYYLKSYVQKLDNESIELQGYNKDIILREIDTLPTRFSLVVPDLIQILASKIVLWGKFNIWFSKRIGRWARKVYFS